MGLSVESTRILKPVNLSEHRIIIRQSGPTPKGAKNARFRSTPKAGIVTICICGQRAESFQMSEDIGGSAVLRPRHQ